MLVMCILKGQNIHYMSGQSQSADKKKSVKRLISMRTSMRASQKTNMGCSTWTLASTFSSPLRGRWNVLNCFVLSDE